MNVDAFESPDLADLLNTLNLCLRRLESFCSISGGNVRKFKKIANVDFQSAVKIF